jgi:glycosyltransferase involved in cell wall biosynthesis
VIFNGFDADAFCKPSASSPIKAECGMGEHPVAMIAGRLTPWKGQHVFIQAVAQVDGLHGWIAGEALFTDEDRAYANKLRQLVSELNIQDRIHFLGFRDDLIPLYQSADIIAHCSTAPEPFGRVIVEGMLCGKPVVATRLGGACEIIEDRDTGLLVEPGYPEALADAMRMLIDDKAEAHRLAQSGQASALQRFDMKKVTHQIKEVIHRVAIA